MNNDPTTLQERLWEAVAEVRDQHPRVFNDAPTDDVIAAVLPIIATEARKAQADALREYADALEAVPDYAPTEYDQGRVDQRHMAAAELYDRADRVEKDRP